jgi:hypothetical protein
MALIASTVLLSYGEGRALAQEARPVSVFVVDVAGDGRRLTGAKDGVLFDLDRKGTPLRVG